MGVTGQNSTKKGIKEIMNFAIFLDFSRLKIILRKLFALIASNFNNKEVDTIYLFFPGSLLIFVVTLSLTPGICRQNYGWKFHEKTVTVRITYLSKIEKKKCWYHRPLFGYFGCFIIKKSMILPPVMKLWLILNIITIRKC